MLKAIIFDFNGIILNDEPLHFEAMRGTVAAFGVDLKKEDYWGRYLPLDDRHCLEAIAQDYSISLGEADRENALKHKASAYRALLQDGFSLFPGVSEFIRSAAGQYSLAIASGARREEIESTLESTGLRSYFVEIVAAEDFVRGKPHPESFLFALQKLNASFDSNFILPGECLVIEDSVEGVQGAKAAGMVCLAVTNSYPRPMLAAADIVVDSLEKLHVGSLEDLLTESM